MIRSVFLPERIKNYYLFSKKIAGIALSKTAVKATLVQAYGNNRSIEQCIEIPLETGPAEDLTNRTIEALKKLTETMGFVHEIRTALPSSVVVFKELRVPFSSYEKISLVIPFEVEPLLPFALADAIVDFIITSIDPETKHAHVLVAALQKVHIEQHLELFAQAGINPNRISIDIFDIYSLYKAIPLYNTNDTSALINIGLHDTTIAYIDSGRLRFIRTLPKGILAWAKQVGDTLNITPAQAMEHIMRFGTQQADWPEYSTAMQQCTQTFLESIQFTLTSFGTQTQSKKAVDSIILLSDSDVPKGFAETAHHILKIPTTLFSQESITLIPNTTLKSGISWTSINPLSCAIALTTPTSEFCNLRKQEFEVVNRTVVYAQLATTVALSVLILITLGVYSYRQLNILSREATESESESIAILSERFKNIESDSGNLDDIIESAQKSLDAERKTWSAFAGESRISYLRYLLELTNVIDKEALGLVLDKITFTENYMILKGRVKDYDAIKLLSQELRQSKLFTHVDREINTQFDALKVTLAHGKGKE